VTVQIGDVTVRYHTTDQAEAILRDGFRDGTGSFMLAGLTLTGVFVSRWPVDCNEGANGEGGWRSPSLTTST
jgi:hypothetical protein